MPRRLALFVLSLAFLSTTAYAQASKVTKETIPGISTFARLETTVACGGTTKAEAVPAIKQMGFVSIINVREARWTAGTRRARSKKRRR